MVYKKVKKSSERKTCQIKKLKSWERRQADIENGEQECGQDRKIGEIQGNICQAQNRGQSRTNRKYRGNKREVTETEELQKM